MIVSAIAMLAPVVGATSTTNNNASPADEAEGTENILILEFTVSDGGDVSVAGVTLSAGTSVTDNNPFASVAFYDNDDAVWDSASDVIVTDDGGSGTYSDAADTQVSRGDDTSIDATDENALNDLDETTYLIVDLNNNGSIDSPGEDDIVTDNGGSGTYSAAPDTVYNAGEDGTEDVSDGASSLSLDVSTYLVSDVDDSSTINVGDEIVLDQGGSGTFSATLDQVISRGNDTTVDTPAGTLLHDLSESTYLLVDQDGDGVIDSSEDDIVIDQGGSGTFSTGADTKINAGEDTTFDMSNMDPSTAMPATTYAIDVNDSADINQGDEVVSLVNDHDGSDDVANDDTLKTFGASARYFDKDGSTDYNTGDEVYLDLDDDSVYTSTADTALNTGNDDVIDTPSTSDLSDVSTIGPGTYYLVDSDGDSAFDAGEDIVKDDDGDGVYTGTADTIVNDHDASDDSIAGDDLLDLGTDARYFDKDGSTDYNTGDEVYLDQDGDGVYTDAADTVIDINGTGGSADYGSAADMSQGDTVTPYNIQTTVDDLNNEIYYVDDGTNDGTYEADDDVYFSGLAGVETTDTCISKGSNGTLVGTYSDTADAHSFDEGDQVSIEGSDEDYEDGEDVIMDPHDGGTYSDSGDLQVNAGEDGTFNMSDGASATNNDLAESTYLAADTDGSTGISLADEIVTDDGGDGTFSATKDTMVHQGASNNSTNGDSLVDVSTLTDPANLKWFDGGGVGLNTGDEDEFFNDVGGSGGGSATYSADQDTQINAGEDGTFTMSDGASATNNDLDEATYFAIDVDGSGGVNTGDEVVSLVNDHDGSDDVANDDTLKTFGASARYFDKDGGGAYDTGDEVFLDLDSDTVYTSTADTVVNDEGAPNRTVGNDLYNLGTSAYYYDQDASGTYTTGDEVFLDQDSDGYYTAQIDTIVNNHDGSDDSANGDTLLSFASARYYDADGSGDYTTGDEVFVDADGDEVFTGQADTVVNDEGSADRAAGDDLLQPTDAMYFDKDGSGDYNAGDEVYLDDDSDDYYTSGNDPIIAGTGPSAGTPLTTTNPGWNLRLYDNGDGAWDSSVDAVVDDNDLNGVWRDSLNALSVTNAAAQSPLENAQVSSITAWSDAGAAGFTPSTDVDITDNVTWDGENWTIDVTDTAVPAAGQTFFVSVDAASPLSSAYKVTAETASMTTAGSETLSVGSNNSQWVYSGLDKNYYATGDNVNLTIYDNSKNLDAGDLDTVTVNLDSPQEAQDPLVLDETGPDTGIFKDSYWLVENGTGLVVDDDDTITLYYEGSPIDNAVIDDTGPVVENLEAANMVENQFVKPGSRTLQADVLENNGWTAKFYVDGVNVENDAGSGDATASVAWDASSSSDNVYDVEVEVEDDYGYTSSASTTLTVDNTAPQVTNPVADPAIIDNENPLSIDLSVDVTDNLFADFAESGVSSVEVDVAPLQYGVDENYVAMSGPDNGVWTYTLAAADINQDNVGTYDLTVEATDNMGQSGYSANLDNAENISVEVIDDDTAPVLENVTVTYPSGQVDEVKQGQTITVSADAVDADSVIDSVEVNAENLGAGTIGLAYTSGNTYENTITVSTDNTGSLQIEVTATDSATNSTSTTTTVNAVPQVSEYEFTLENGWNMISLPLIPKSTEIEDVIAGIEENVVIVEAYDTAAGDWLTYEPGAAVNDLSTMEDGVGYWIKMDLESPVTMTVEGLETPMGGAVPPLYNLQEGWNLVGFSRVSSATVNEYLGGVSDQVSTMSVWAYSKDIDRLVSVGASYELDPGEGIWVYVSSPAELVPW